MRQTLFYLPETVAGIPLFGLGWALGITLVLGAMAIGWTRRSSNLQTALFSWGPTLALAIVVIVFVLPAIERMPAVAPGDNLPNHGVPIRGYGVVLFVACASAVALAAQRAPARGISPDTIYQLAFSFFVCGILGARTAFFAQYWDRYEIHSFMDLVWAFVRIAEGGLVVYGSLIGAALAFAWFSWRHRISVRRLGDVIAPCLLLGLAIGRIGCFLNGCCWGGVSDLPWSVRFPASSPAYVDQAQRGLFWGVRLVPRGEQLVVGEVLPNSAASRAGLERGDVIRAVGPVTVATGADEATRQRVANQLLTEGDSLVVQTADGRSLHLERHGLPDRALPVHPTQLYSSLGALLLMALVLAYDRRRPPDGAVTALAFTLYPVARFLLEFLRDDEPGAWGTPLTLAQWMSVVVLVFAVVLWIDVSRRARNTRQNQPVGGKGARPATPRQGTYAGPKASKVVP